MCMNTVNVVHVVFQLTSAPLNIMATMLPWQWEWRCWCSSSSWWWSTLWPAAGEPGATSCCEEAVQNQTDVTDHNQSVTVSCTAWFGKKCQSFILLLQIETVILWHRTRQTFKAQINFFKNHETLNTSHWLRAHAGVVEGKSSEQYIGTLS